MSTLERVLGYSLPRKSLLVGIWVAQLGQIAYTLLIPAIIKEAIDRGVVGRDLTFLIAGAAAIVLSSVLRGVLWQHVIYGYQQLGLGISRELRDLIYEKVQRSSLSYHTGARSGDLFSNATIDLGAIEEFYTAGIRELLNVVVMSALVVVTLVRLDAGLTLAALPTFVAVAALAVYYGPRARERYRRIQMEYGRTTSMLQENLNGVRVVKAFAREPHETRRFTEQVRKLYDANMRVAVLNSLVWPSMSLATTLGVAAILWLGGQRVLDGALTLGGLVAFITYLTMLVGPVRGLGMTINLVTGAIAGAERIHALLDHRQVIQSVDEGRRRQELPTIAGAIAFEGVTFGYHAGDPVLRRVDLRAAPGETIGVVGLTGAGKSTLALLLGRFYDPNAGTVRIDGHDLRDVSLRSLRRQVGFVFQEAFLFSATIAENIAFGRPEASQAEVEEAARLACLHDFVVGLPEGYATMLGERGITLSGGQRQRLALARALLVAPRILVLDDTTSAVDPVTEAEIWRRVKAAREGTTLIIAQRVASVRHAHQILVLEKGEVVERGRHEELVGQGGLYARLYHQQTSQAENVIDHERLLDDGAAASGQAPAAGEPDGRVAPAARGARAAAAEDAALLPPAAPAGASADGKPARRDVLSLNPEDDTVLGKAYDHALMVRLLEFLRPFQRLILATVGAMAATSGASLAFPYIQKLAIDGPIAFGDAAGLRSVALLFAGLGLFSWGFQVVYNYLLHRVAQEVLQALRLHVFAHLQALSLSFYDRYRVGRLMSVMTGDVQAISNLLGGGIVAVIADFFVLVGVIGALLGLNLRLSLFTFSVLPAIAIAASILRHFARENFRNVRRASSILNGALAENIAGVRVTQAYCREEVNRRAFDRLNGALWQHGLSASFVMSVFGPTMDLIGSVATAMILAYGGYLAISHQLSIGVLVAFTAYASRFFEPIRDLTVRYNSLQAAMAASERIFALLDTPPAVVDRPDAGRLPAVRGRLALDHVTFGYSPGRTILHDLNLRIAPGEQVAIVGPTGAGKTSIISLACRFYDVTDGAIRIDGHDLRSVTMASLRRQIAVVLQEPFLFSGTIAENLRFGKLDATPAELEQACRAVGIHDFIARLPLGYQTEVSERGGNLSAGQRQLISFARALLADPRILILDEATSSVDTVTEAQVQEALRLLLQGRTAIVIAHRLSTVRSADRIVVLEAGRIVEVGSHAELIRAGGHYARLHRAAGPRPAVGAAS